MKTGIVSRTRIHSLDMMRGIAVLLMVQQHTGYWFWKSGSGISSLLSSHPVMITINGLGGLAAPLFILLAGAGASLSINNGNPERERVLRGIILILFGYMLNITVPAWFSPWSWYVLHLIGTGMCLSPLFRRMSTATLFAAAIIIIVASVVSLDIFNMPRYFSNGLMRGKFSAAGILKPALFSGNFPVLPWLALFITGFISGRFISGREYFGLLKIAAAAFSIAVVLFVIGEFNPVFAKNSFCRRLMLVNLYMYPAYPIPFLTLSAASVLLVYIVLIAGERYTISGNNILVLTGRVSLSVFILHIVIIRNFMVYSGLWQSFSEPVTMLLQVAVIAAIMLLVFFWKRKDFRYGFEWLLRLV